MPTVRMYGMQHQFPDGATEEEIRSALFGMTQNAPGVDMPGLPDSRTLPTPKKFSELGNAAEEYANRQRPVGQILDGAARMKRPGADAKFGGASDIMLGAAEIAAPLAAVPLAGAGSIGAAAAMLPRMALGAGEGYLGGKLLRAQVPKDRPGLQNFVENAGTFAGGLLAGGVSESPKVGAFVKGAAKAAPTSMVRSGPYGMGGAVLHALGHNKSALAADAVAAAAGLPAVIRGGMAEAAGKPWLGPVFSGILGKNKPQPVEPSIPGTYGVRNFDVGPPRPTSTPVNFSLQSGTAGRPASSTPPAAAGTYGAKNFDVGAPRPMSTPSNASLQSGTAGRPSGLLATELSLTPAEIIARQEEALRNIEALKARQAANQNRRPVPTPKEPAAKPTTPSENAAARMAAQDAAGQERTGLMNDVVAEAEAKAAERLMWEEMGGKFMAKQTKTKQDALIAFAAETKKPMTRFTEAEYNDLVSEFNAAGKKRATGKPFKVNFAGADYDADGSKAGRNVETTLRHFNNMRLGKE